MDMRKYVGSSFLKVDDVREGPIQVTITGVSEGRYDKPDLTFDDGSKLSVNASNSRVLAKEYGYESDDWIGKRIELVLGEIDYRGEKQPSIIVKPVSPPDKNKKAPSPKSDMDDDPPF